MSASRACCLCGLLATWVALYPTSSLAAEACFILDLYDSQAYPAEKSASISLTTLTPGVDGAPELANLQEFNRAFLQVLNESLLDSKFYKSVTVASADDAARGDYVVAAGVRGVNRRNFAGRIWGGGARMRIGGTLFGPAAGAGSRPLIGHWECAGTNAGGFLGGGLLAGAGSNERAASNNVKNIAKALARALADKDMKKELTKKAEKAAKDDSEKPLRGETEVDERKWRAKTDWDKRDYGDEIESFVVSNERKRARGVDALWVNDTSYQAHQKLLPMLDLSDALLRPCWPGRCGDGEEIERGTLLDIEPLERFKGQDVYVVALTFSTALGETPVVWAGDRVRRATILARADQPGASVAPIEFLDEPGCGLCRRCHSGN
jgi:hypothetical protein